MQKVLLSFILLISIHFGTNAQLSISALTDNEIEVCQDAKDMEVLLKNNSGSSMSIDSIVVALPSGISYVSASILTMHGSTVSELNADDSSPSFQTGNIPAGDSIKFRISYNAGVPAIAYQDQGNVFENIITVYDGGSQLASDVSESYNILYPVLAITNVSPTSATFVSGLSEARSITIVNAGNGKADKIYLTDVRNSGVLNLVSSSLGAINGDTIVLSGSDFSGIGDGDQYFETNETIVITETLSGVSCTDVTVTSSLNAAWGCSGDLISTSTSYANMTIDFQSPNIALSSNSTLEACFDNVGSTQHLTLRNSGSGVANNVNVDIYKSTGGSYNQTIFSRFDASSLYYTVGANGSPVYVSPTTTLTNTSGDYAVLGTGAVGRMEFTVGTMAPGDTIHVYWDMYSQVSGVCQDEKYAGWRAEVDYTDVCDNGPYTKTHTGQGTNSQYMTIFTESTAEIEAGVTEMFVYTISSFNNSLVDLTNSDGQYKVIFTLDAGLQYESAAWKSNSDEWTPTSTSTSGNTVTLYFQGPEPFTLPKSEIQLNVSGICGQSGWKNMELDLSFIPETSCTPEFEIPMICDETISTYLHCPELSCGGLRFIDFTAQRVNYGTSDNNLDGAPDGTNSLDFSKIRVKRAMVGDTVQVVLRGVVDGTTGTISYGKAEVTNNYGVHLSPVATTVRIVESGAGEYTVNGVQNTQVTTGNSSTFTVDLDVSYLSSINAGLTGFTYQNGDSVIVTCNYRLVSSITGNIRETDWSADYYLSEVANPTQQQKLQCDQQYTRTTFIGNFWINESPNNFTVKSCSKYVVQNFGLSIGDCCSNYGGGNLFPYEYRNWGHLKEVKVVKPADYALLTTKVRLYNTRRTNSTIYKQITITPDQVIGDTLYYDIEQYYESGDYSYGDDGFNGQFRIELAPECDVPQNVYVPVEWFFNYQESAAINGQETGYIQSTGVDQIRYTPASIDITSTNPIQDANQRDVSWNVRLNNNNSSSTANTWLHIDVPSNFTITSVTSGGNPLTQQSDLYVIGTINSNSHRDVVINGQFSNCDTVSFDIHSGFECSGLPSSFAAFGCDYDTYTLYVEPKNSNYQTRIKTLETGDFCSQYVNVELDITSVAIAHMYDMEITMTVNDTTKIKVMNDSSYFLYPYSSTYSGISTPAYNGTGYDFIINDYNPSFAQDGIPGVFDLSNNRYKLKATLELGGNYLPGDLVNIKIEGKNACAENLKTINLVYDPSIRFSKNEVSGLHIDISNSWTASWGDYDNDGYEDLFVPGYEVSDGNLLYHNDGDGTFTKVLTGDIVTTQGSAVSSTWGDYDNDGDLDLFVAYNANGEDKLFRNDGGGTFTSIENDPIVTSGTYSHCAAWGDYDNDGYLDLIISDYHITKNNSLIHNKGDGTFELVEDSPISLQASSSVGVSWCDYDNDGDIDVFIANTNHQDNLLYENIAGVFERVTTGPVVTDGGTSVGGTWGDCDGDGDMDLFVSNSSDQHPNFLYINDGAGNFTKNTTSVLVQDSAFSHGATWVDYDNDGDMDLMVANNLGENHLFSNNGSGNFAKLSNEMTTEYSESYGVAWADYDNDGDYDVLIANQGANANDFFTNDKGNCHNYLGVNLSGCHSNKMAFGAKIKAKALIDGQYKWQTKEISSQNNGLGGQNSLKTFIGVKNATVVDSIIVLWPSGVRQVLTNQAVNQSVTFVEDCGAKVCGYVYYDQNQNGVKDVGEPGLANHTVNITPYNSIVFTTNDQGYYQTYLLEDTYNLSYGGHQDWALSVDTTYGVTVNLSEGVDYCGNDFGVIPLCADPDLRVQTSAGAFRRGLRNDLTVVVSNDGVVTAENTVLDISFSSNTFLVENTGDNETLGANNQYQFNIGALAPFTDTVLRLIDSVSVSSALEELVVLNISATSSGADCDNANNTILLQDKVVGSVDPNEKYVMQKGGDKFNGFVTRGNPIYYKIAFQNVGTYPAQRAEIIDSLSEDLDWETVEILNSSHSFSFTRDRHILRWLNEDIQLMDSTTNEEESHGFISFLVYPREGLDAYSKIYNSASIQFDYNEYIITNEVAVSTLPVNPVNHNVVVYPSPFDVTADALLVDLETNMSRTIVRVQITDLSGNVVHTSDEECERFKIDMYLNQGVYLIKLYDKEGNAGIGRFTKM